MIQVAGLVAGYHMTMALLGVALGMLA